MLIDGSQTPGGGVSSVTINTGGSIIVEGALDYVDAAATDEMNLDAGQNIEVVTDAGGASRSPTAPASFRAR